jgi:hypothetical protein
MKIFLNDFTIFSDWSIHLEHIHTITRKMNGACFCQSQLLQGSVGVGGLRGRHLSMHAPHRVLSWARIHHVGPTEWVLCLEIETSLAVAILQISCSYAWPPSASASPALANPPKTIFLGSLMFPILTMCPAHCVRVLFSIAGICSMLHLVATFTLLSFYHHFTRNSLRKKPMWMALNFPA